MATHQNDQQQAPLHEIGKGQCGKVHTIKGTQYVIKTMNEGKKDQLWNDSCHHLRIEEAFKKVPEVLQNIVQVPRFHAWVHPKNKFWDKHRDSPTYGLVSTRIEGLPISLCSKFINQVYPQGYGMSEGKLREHPDRENCLARVYLGRELIRTASSPFKLRNFELHINELEDLGYDTLELAKTMAQTLAVLHWSAGNDANDVEFVLGRAPQTPYLTFSKHKVVGPDDAGFFEVEIDVRDETVSVWLLDFDQSSTFEHNDAGLKQLVNGFYLNDPYYPRPTLTEARDVALWLFFKDCYLKSSAMLNGTEMPKRFIEGVEAEGDKRKAGRYLFM